VDVTKENEMSKLMKRSLLTAITIGLTSGSAIAAGAGKGLAGQATNPIANLVQFQMQNTYTANSHNVSGDSNTFIIQPVVPINLDSESVPLLVTRTTLPYINTPDFGDGVGTKEGFGDLVTQGYFIPKLESKKAMIGVGYNLTVPTAGDNDYTGSGKWSLGPGAVYFNLANPSLQWGLLGYSSFSFASQNSDRGHVSTVSLQPILVKHFDEGWYAGLPDVPQTYNFDTKEWTLAVGPRVGKVTKFGKQPVNLFGQITYNPNDDTDEIAPDWSYKVNVTFLFPK
jgi:hypothetical protein